MKHLGGNPKTSEVIQRGLNEVFALLACLAVSAFLTRDREWSYLLLMSSPFIALFVCLLVLKRMDRLKKRRKAEMPPPLSASILAAAQEKFRVVRPAKSAAVRPDNAYIVTAEKSGLCEKEAGLIVREESIHHDRAYAVSLAAMAWLWLLIAIPFLTDAACNFFAGMALTLFWMLLALAWLAGLFFASCFSPRAGYLWLSAALAGVLGLLLTFTDLGFQLRVALSERWLTAYVSAVPLGAKDALHSERQVGLFGVDGTEESNGVVLLYTSHSFLDRHGIAYIPVGTVPPPQVRSLKHLFGPWYSFQWHF